MASVLRTVKDCKKLKRLGEVQIVGRQDYAGFALDAKVELIRSLVPLGLMHVQELLDDEVWALAGARYARRDGCAGMRHGSNPDSVRLAGQRVRGAQGEIPLRSYAALQGPGAEDEKLLRRVLYGISCRNYKAAAVSCLVIPDGCIGLPTLAALEQGIPVIAVRGNTNIMKNDLATLPWARNQPDMVENYLEALGIMAALKSGVAIDTLNRLLANAQNSENPFVSSDVRRDATKRDSAAR
ncbi:MAG: DUF3326 domain-containing protein [Gammaproteobacteria bacterium]|nr:DUF3326 domain-containing protein [Gammaproteobacteria bacterium]